MPGNSQNPPPLQSTREAALRDPKAFSVSQLYLDVLGAAERESKKTVPAMKELAVSGSQPLSWAGTPGWGNMRPQQEFEPQAARIKLPTCSLVCWANIQGKRPGPLTTPTNPPPASRPSSAFPLTQSSLGCCETPTGSCQEPHLACELPQQHAPPRRHFPCFKDQPLPHRLPVFSATHFTQKHSQALTLAFGIAQRPCPGRKGTHAVLKRKRNGVQNELTLGLVTEPPCTSVPLTRLSDGRALSNSAEKKALIKW